MTSVKKVQIGSTIYDIEATSMKEEALSWGGNAQAGTVSPIGMALSNEHSANRLAFLNGNALTFEYSSDAGATWTDFGWANSSKSQLFTKDITLPVGVADNNTPRTAKSQTRITITAQNGTNGYVYTSPKKLLINVTSAGDLVVDIQLRSGDKYKTNGAWTTFGTYSLSGWSGWNDIPLILGTLGGGSDQTGNIWQLRLIFRVTTLNSSYPKVYSVNSIRLFGDNAWVALTNLSRLNTIYDFDMSQNVTFPAQVKASTFYNSAGKQVSYEGHTHNYASATHAHDVTVPNPSVSTAKLVTTTAVSGIANGKKAYEAKVNGTVLELTEITLNTTTVATGSISASGTGAQVATGMTVGSKTVTTGQPK